jgi:hypothetical protein
MVVDLSRFGMQGRFEHLTILSSPAGGYVVACLPFFTRGIAFGDLVAVEGPENRFCHVVERSGLRTLRAAFTDQSLAEKDHPELHQVIYEMGHPHEWHGSGYLAVLIRSLADQQQVADGLNKWIADGTLLCEVDPEPFGDDEA